MKRRIWDRSSTLHVDVSRAELELMPTWVVRMVTGRVLRSGWDRERIGPLFDIPADVDSGAFRFVLTSFIIQHHYEVLAIWLRARLS